MNLDLFAAWTVAGVSLFLMSVCFVQWQFAKMELRDEKWSTAHWYKEFELMTQARHDLRVKLTKYGLLEKNDP